MELEAMILRPLRRADYPAAEDIIRRTWKYDELGGSPKDARHMARLYLRACLQRATYALAAEAGGRVLGVILARSRRAAPRCAPGRTLSLLSAAALLLTTKAGRRLGKFFGGFDQVDDELLAQTGRAFDGEICFFAVEEGARGTGVGKKLFAAALDHLRAERAKSLYLFTDTSCSYQFYEKRGLQRLGEKLITFEPHTDYRLRMFIYGYDLA